MNSSALRSLILRTLSLFAVWIVLSQSFTVFHLGLGFLASFAVARLNTGHAQSHAAKASWVRLALYLPWLLWKVLQSGIHLSYLILHPRLPINPKLISYQTRLQTPAGIVMLGNSITLTPGTITAEVNSTSLLIHAMDDPSAGDLTSLERKISGIFGVEQ